MFASKSVLELMSRENDRLSKELQRKDEIILELIDRFVNNRIPQRLAPEPKTIFNSPTVTSSYPSDAYSQAIEDAERLASQRQLIPLTDNEDEDDQLF